VIDICSKKTEKVYNNIIEIFSNQWLPNIFTNTLLFETIGHHIDIHYKKKNDLSYENTTFVKWLI